MSIKHLRIHTDSREVGKGMTMVSRPQVFLDGYPVDPISFRLEWGPGDGVPALTIELPVVVDTETPVEVVATEAPETTNDQKQA